jgi:acetoacetate decarboxylase
MFRHVMTDVAGLPVLKSVSALHFVADLTLDMGKVAHDYLKEAQ